MDRSYLSDREIVQAAREFVCVRLATYEDKAEGKFLESIFRGRSGELELSRAVVGAAHPRARGLYGAGGVRAVDLY